MQRKQEEERDRLAYNQKLAEKLTWRTFHELCVEKAREGLADYLLKNGFERLVDATHPYSVRIATNAVGTPTKTLAISP